MTACTSSSLKKFVLRPSKQKAANAALTKQAKIFYFKLQQEQRLNEDFHYTGEKSRDTKKIFESILTIPGCG